MRRGLWPGIWMAGLRRCGAPTPHVPTADCQLLPKGTGFVTDLGMTGPYRSVLGIRPEHSMNLFLGGLPRRYEEAEGPCKLEACRFTIDTEKKRCVEVRRADLWE